jgi:hypothetical protein
VLGRCFRHADTYADANTYAYAYAYPDTNAYSYAEWLMQGWFDDLRHG